MSGFFIIKGKNMKNRIATLNTVIKYLSLIHSNIYQEKGMFNEKDILKIEKKGYNIELISYYDGKILKVTDQYIATHSTKCQGMHNIYIKGQKGIVLTFFEKKEDLEKEYKDSIHKENMSLLKEEGDEDLKWLYTKLNTNIIKNYSNIVLKITK